MAACCRQASISGEHHNGIHTHSNLPSKWNSVRDGLAIGGCSLLNRDLNRFYELSLRPLALSSQLT